MKSQNKTRIMVSVAMLSAASYLLAFTAGLVYNKHKTKRTAMTGCAVGSAAMALAASVRKLYAAGTGYCLIRGIHPFY